MIKIAHITNYYHKKSGGISTSFNALMAAAERHQREMVLIVPGEKDEVEQVNEFAKIYFIESSQSFLFDKRYRVIYPWQYMPSGSKIRKILLDEMPDMLEVTDKYTLSMLGAMVRRGKFRQLGRIPVIHFSCERMDDNVASFLSGGSLGKRFSRSLMGYYNIPSFDYHIANSPYTAEEMVVAIDPEERPARSKGFLNRTWRFFRSPRVPLKERLFVCPRGVDADQFSPDRKNESTRAELIDLSGAAKNPFLILYAGRVSPEKNVGLLTAMMRELANDDKRDYRLLIAGDGPLKESMENEVEKDFPGKIVFLGHLDKETLANYYSNVDVFVHPNPKEPFGIGPLEAMASGTPTVVPNAGGLLFYASEENTWLVKPEAKEFADAVRECSENPDLRKSKIEGGFKAVSENTRIKSTDFLFETYDKIWKDFNEKKDLFVDQEASQGFDHSKLTRPTS